MAYPHFRYPTDECRANANEYQRVPLSLSLSLVYAFYSPAAGPRKN